MFNGQMMEWKLSRCIVSPQPACVAILVHETGISSYYHSKIETIELITAEKFEKLTDNRYFCPK